MLRLLYCMFLFWGIHKRIPQSNVAQAFTTESSYMSTSDVLASGASQSPVLYLSGKVAKFWDEYFFGVITVVLGVCGNILSIILLQRTRLQRSPTSFYMTALAITDSCVLVFGVAGNHTMRSHGVAINSNIYCKIMYFIVKWCGSASDWILACMSVERCLAITMPLKSKRVLNPRANKISLCVLLLCVGAYFSHVFVVYGSYGGICRMVSLAFHPHHRSLIDYTVFTLSPAFFIAISNILIIAGLLKSSKSQANLSEGQENARALQSTNNSLIAMLIAISVAFFVFKSPFLIMKTAVDAKWTGNFQYRFVSDTDADYRLVLAIFLWMAYFNHAINFYLYVLTGKEFRSELRQMIQQIFCCRCRSTPPDASTRDTKETHFSTTTEPPRQHDYI